MAKDNKKIAVRVDEHRQIRDAKVIEDVICLAVLITNHVLPIHATVSDATRRFDGKDIMSICDNCGFVNDCLACIINE